MSMQVDKENIRGRWRADERAGSRLLDVSDRQDLPVYPGFSDPLVNGMRVQG